MDNTTFSNLSQVSIRYSMELTVTNSKAFVKDGYFITIGVNTIIIDNVFSTGSFEMLHPVFAYVRNSEFMGSTRLGLRLTDANGFVNITNTNFTKCVKPLVIENTITPHCKIEITNCFFRHNNANEGGAVYIASDVDEVKLSNCVFISNMANKNGGALYYTNPEDSFKWTNAKLTIESCKFIKNYAGGILLSDIDQGNGGAIYAQGKILELSDDTVFLENSAVRGGAIFTNSFISQTNALIKSNEGRLAGGGVFLFKTDTANNNNFNFQNNSALYYGRDRASFIKKVIIEYQDGGARTPELTVFPGLQFEVLVNAYDIYGSSVVRILEPPSYKPNFDVEVITLITVSTDFGGIHKFYVVTNAEYSSPPNGELKNLTVHFSEASTIMKFKLINCPSNYIKKYVDNKLFCEHKDFPLSAVISLSVLGGVLIFIIGITVGIIILYGIMKVTRRLKRLEKKEKAELEMEMKIIDRRVIFGDSIDYTPLLEDDRNSSNRSSKKKRLSERKESFLIPIEELEVEKKIGEGGCGTVYSAKWGDNTVAIKSINAIDQEEDFEREVSLLSSLRHPNIVSFYGVTITDSAKFMVIEYLSKGSLKRVLNNVKSGKESLTLLEKLNILIGISQGMNYLHNLKPNAIIHRDLKPENVLLDSNGVCKVCDFGLSKIIGTATQTMTTNVGTLFYLSPEMLKGDNPSTITSKLDVYSFAIIMWELFFEENAYNNSNSSKINYFNHSNEELSAMQNVFLIPSLVAKGVRPTIPFTTDEEKEIWINEFIIPFENNSLNNGKREQIFIVIDKYIQLLKECWSDNPNERPSFAEIIPQLKALKQNL